MNPDDAERARARSELNAPCAESDGQMLTDDPMVMMRTIAEGLLQNAFDERQKRGAMMLLAFLKERPIVREYVDASRAFDHARFEQASKLGLIDLRLLESFSNRLDAAVAALERFEQSSDYKLIAVVPR